MIEVLVFVVAVVAFVACYMTGTYVWAGWVSRREARETEDRLRRQADGELSEEDSARMRRSARARGRDSLSKRAYRAARAQTYRDRRTKEAVEMRRAAEKARMAGEDRAAAALGSEAEKTEKERDLWAAELEREQSGA